MDEQPLSRQKEDTKNNPAAARTDYAYERTQMAATRTYFAILRTGLAIAGGGTLVTAILGEGWPDWIVGILAGTFILIGFSIMLSGLFRYTSIARVLVVEDSLNFINPNFLIVLTIILQLATVAVLALYLIGP